MNLILQQTIPPICLGSVQIQHDLAMILPSVLSYLYTCRKIPKISPGAYIFQKPFLRGLLWKGLMYGGKFAFKNRLGQPHSWKEIYRFSLFYFAFEGNFTSTSPPGGLYLEGRFNGGFLRYEFVGLIHGGVYFRNFTVLLILSYTYKQVCIAKEYVALFTKPYWYIFNTS